MGSEGKRAKSKHVSTLTHSLFNSEAVDDGDDFFAPKQTSKREETKVVFFCYRDKCSNSWGGRRGSLSWCGLRGVVFWGEVGEVHCRGVVFVVWSSGGR